MWLMQTDEMRIAPIKAGLVVAVIVLFAGALVRYTPIIGGRT